MKGPDGAPGRLREELEDKPTLVPYLVRVRIPRQLKRGRSGTLTPRSEPDAVIHDAQRAAAQTVHLIREGKVKTPQGEDILLVADTLCIYGDGPEALELAFLIKDRLEQAGVAVRPYGR
nr:MULTISPECIES: LamB/YcsF family protein [unclassified Paenibacillus]